MYQTVRVLVQTIKTHNWKSETLLDYVFNLVISYFNEYILVYTDKI